ncbi:MAG: DUF4369 domain-containing protein [Muribaculaceae bacterium]|nr:DUF4369 domain-containing protein [Muribaculaceae bacterium]
MTKKFFTHWLLALWALMLSLASCDSTGVGTEQGDYVVAIEVDSLKCDSVSLVVVEPAYNALRSLGHRRLKNGKASFKGQIDSPRIAMLKLNRASKPFYFILEPCTTSITIDRQRIIVWGGKVNHEYFSHVRRRGRLIALVDSVRASYARSLADSTLTPGREAWLLKRNDRLNNSLQAMTLHLVKRTDVVGALYRDQYGADLDSAHYVQLLIKR